MAGSLNQEGALPALDDAVRLLRQASLGTFVCHWIGSVPFALATLRFWNDMTNPRIEASTSALDAMMLAVLLVWLNCWRTVFAGRLRRQLTGAPAPPWTRQRLWNMVAGQALWGSTRLLVLPLAGLVLFPLAATVACYRNLAVLGDQGDLDPFELMRRARHLAVAEVRQSWALLPILTFLFLILMVNLALVLGVLPQLVRMLTGYETAFSRSGYYFVFNPLFLLLVIAVSWIAFDPYIQAVYCVRCFRVESMETGEDLRAGLRHIRSAVSAAVLLVVLMSTPAHLSAAVPARDLERSVEITRQSHEYDWRLPPAAASPQKQSWLVRFVDRMIAAARSLSNTLSEWVKALFRWLTGQRVALPQGGQAPTRGLHWSLYAITAAVVLIVFAILWKWSRRRLKPEVAAAPVTLAVRLEADDLSPDRLPEQEWLAMADQCLRDGNFRLALRACYLANLAWLGRAGLLSIHPGKTNREYEFELRRKARQAPDARSLFAANIDAFERAWYGLHDVAAEDVADYRSRVDRMKTLLPQATGVAA